jgi:uncharacterized protein with HEPN domain
MLMTAAAVAAIAEAGANVLTLVEGLDEADFRRSRLTRAEVRRQLHGIAAVLAALAEPAQARMPELDWPAWAAVDAALRQDGPACDDTAWFAARSLLPATLMWLRVYRQSEPALFDFRP